ncbi:MAG: hypothetical protein KME17_11600 [Cyanosarcina radialis HA8281-LM2]|jgi:hypothetical protein|nr:hypothetical protein [Cyanosarcina radialis HA8281-LM2]
MATIAIQDLNPAGYSLFADGESYLAELSSDDQLNIAGGKVSSLVSFASGISIGISLVTLVISLARYVHK